MVDFFLPLSNITVVNGRRQRMQRPLPVRIGTLDNFSVADKPDSPTSMLTASI